MRTKGIDSQRELVVRYADGLVQKLETRNVHQPTSAPTPAHLRCGGSAARASVNLQQLLLEMRAALETPIDFADL